MDRDEPGRSRPRAPIRGEARLRHSWRPGPTPARRLGGPRVPTREHAAGASRLSPSGASVRRAARGGVAGRRPGAPAAPAAPSTPRGGSWVDGRWRSGPGSPWAERPGTGTRSCDRGGRRGGSDGARAAGFGWSPSRCRWRPRKRPSGCGPRGSPTSRSCVDPPTSTRPSGWRAGRATTPGWRSRPRARSATCRTWWCGPLTPDAPVVDGIVEELFPAAALTDFHVFFDTGGSDAELGRRMTAMTDSVARFSGPDARSTWSPTSRLRARLVPLRG